MYILSYKLVLVSKTLRESNFLYFYSSRNPDTTQIHAEMTMMYVRVTTVICSHELNTRRRGRDLDPNKEAARLLNHPREPCSLGAPVVRRCKLDTSRRNRSPCVGCVGACIACAGGF